MNRIWSILMLVSIAALIYLQPGQVLPGMIGAVNDALKLSFSLMALYTIWLGIINILAKTGLNSKLARLLKPLIRLLFGEIPDDAAEYISLNMSANLLGMGNAATPMGVKAMNALDDKSGRATDAMIMLLVINATSIQLLPSTVISLRAAAGSIAPGNIILPTLITSAVSATIAALLAKLCAKICKATAKRKQAAPLPDLTAQTPVSLAAKRKQSAPLSDLTTQKPVDLTANLNGGTQRRNAAARTLTNQGKTL